MKKRIIPLISLLLVLCACFSVFIPAYAAQTVSGNRSVDGVAYKLSEDGEYYTVVGRSEDFPKLTIVSDIDGIPVTGISDYAFTNTKSLTEIVIPSSVTVIGKSAFRFCENLVSVTLPARLTYLPEECFYDCKILSNIVLPKTLIGIGDRAFYNCTMLGELAVPASVTEIGYDVFHGCESIILDVSANPIADQYAKDNNVNTDFKNSSGYFLMIVGIALAAAAVLFTVFAVWFKSHVKKHPKHDPTIYIDKFFSAIERFFGFFAKKIRICFDFIAKHTVRFVNYLGKKSRERKLKKAEKRELSKKQDNDTE
jgi:ABC-type multidrug transport system fused ATPase/permease subunit